MPAVAEREPGLLAETLGAMPRLSTALMSKTLTPPQERSEFQARLEAAKAFAGPLWAAAQMPERALHVLDTQGRSQGIWNISRDAVESKCMNGGMVLLYGQRKTGKTVLATDVALTLMAFKKMSRYVRGLGLLQDLRRKNNVNDAASAELVKPYQRWPFLIIDEVGVRIRGDDYSESDAALLTDLLDTRYQGMVSTLMISNETKAETFKILGPSIVRRIEETGFAIEAKWPAFKS